MLKELEVHVIVIEVVYEFGDVNIGGSGVRGEEVCAEEGGVVERRVVVSGRTVAFLFDEVVQVVFVVLGLSGFESEGRGWRGV